MEKKVLYYVACIGEDGRFHSHPDASLLVGCYISKAYAKKKAFYYAYAMNVRTYVIKAYEGDYYPRTVYLNFYGA